MSKASVAVGIALVLLGGSLQAQTSAPPAFTHTQGEVVRADFGGPLAYDNGMTDPNLDSGNEMSQWVQADDFELASATALTGAEVDWFDLNAGNEWDGGIEWFIFADAAGSPGAIVDQGTGSELTTTLISNANGWDWFTTSFAFDHSVPLAANTRYWFGLHWAADQDYVRDEVYFAFSQAQSFSTSHESELGTFDNWLVVVGEDRGFRLFDVGAAVPAVSHWGLGVLGVGLLLALVVITKRNQAS